MESSVSVRRSPFLVTYWGSGTHWVYNYLRATSRSCTPRMLAILDATDQWIGREALGAALADDDEDLDETIDEMVRIGLLDTPTDLASPVQRALEAWDEWNPAAGFFHSVTKTPIAGRRDEGRWRGRFLVERDRPESLKDFPDRPRVELPAYALNGDLSDALRCRRTWREFDTRNLTLDETATLLGFTFGVQRWLEVDTDHWVALKTSPSGGARHSIEAYVLAFGIEGVDNGTYHYAPDAHALTRLSAPTSRELLADFVPNQHGFHDPAAFVVLTSVFARVQWKYSHPHAYRVVLLDAGHLSQTFALVATALGLAPFCTAAIDAPLIERHLGIDGVSESVVLALGVGARPQGKDWAPMHDHSASPRTRPAEWAARLSAKGAPR